MQNRMRELVSSGVDSYGVFCVLGDAEAVEIAAIAGFDFVIIDLEHFPTSLESMRHQLRAAAARGIGAMVRVPDTDPKFILRVLDSGAEGVMVPHVVSAAMARQVARSVRYQPEGDRGQYDGTRASDYFFHGFPSYKELTESINTAVVLAITIEDAAGVDVCEEIVSTKGIDLTIVGPVDLSASMGLVGTHNHPDVERAIQRVRNATAAAGVRFTVPVRNVAYSMTTDEVRSMGSTVFLGASDAYVLATGFQEHLRELKG